MTNQIFAVFPGQGSQKPAMAKPILEQFPYTKLIFEEAEDAIQIHLSKICSDESLFEQLTATEIQQPSIVATSISLWKILKQETDLSPSLYAGHSLGEYSALVASEKLNFSDAIKLVHQRGKFMQEAVPKGTGAMAAVLKFPLENLQIICSEIAKTTQLSLEIANLNSPNQIIVSGHALAVQELCSTLKKQRVICKKLPVSAPFHSSLMREATANMAPLLRATALLNNDNSVIPNCTGQQEHPYQIDFLIHQIEQKVQWTKTIKSAEEKGVDLQIEVGPGKVLTNLAKQNYKNLPKCIEFQDPKISLASL